jgi:hypothetical protein
VALINWLARSGPMREVGEGAEAEEDDDDDGDEDEEPGLLGSLEPPGLPGSFGPAINEPTRSELVMQRAMVRGKILCFILFPFFRLF